MVTGVLAVSSQCMAFDVLISCCEVQNRHCLSADNSPRLQARLAFLHGLLLFQSHVQGFAYILFECRSFTEAISQLCPLTAPLIHVLSTLRN